jgi:hypothetical protein
MTPYNEAHLNGVMLLIDKEWQGRAKRPNHAFTTTTGHTALYWEFDSPIPTATDEQAVKLSAAIIQELDLQEGSAIMALPHDEIVVDRKLLHNEKAVIKTKPLHKLIQAVSAPLRLAPSKHEYKIAPIDMAPWVARLPFNKETWAPHQDGIQFLTGGVPFMEWRDFVPRKELMRADENFGKEIIDKSACDEIFFYHQVDRGWRKFKGAAPFAKFIKATYAELDNSLEAANRIVSQIMQRNTIAARVHMPYQKLGIVEVDGKRYLNDMHTQVLPPSPPYLPTNPSVKDYLEHGGELAKFLGSVFRQRPGSSELEIFLTWLQHAYANGYSAKETNGQVLGLVGDHEDNLKILGEHLIPTLLGKDAVQSLFRFARNRNINMMDYATHLLKNEIIRRYGDDSYDKPVEGHRSVFMFHSPDKILNLEPVLADHLGEYFTSLHLNPTKDATFPDWEQLESGVPFLGRFLLEWLPGSWYLECGDPSLGCRAYRSPTASGMADPTDSVLSDSLARFVETYCKQNPTKSWWEGSLHDLKVAFKEFDEDTCRLFSGKGTLAFGGLLNVFKKANFNVTSFNRANDHDPETNSDKGSQVVYRIGHPLYKAPNFYFLMKDAVNHVTVEKEFLCKRAHGLLPRSVYLRKDAR